MDKKRKIDQETVLVEKKEKPTPAYLKEDYPYKAIGEPIVNFENLVQKGVLYEIKCPKCEMSFRSQGCNIKSIYERIMNGIEVKNDDGTMRVIGGKGCPGCGNREFIIRKVDTSKMEEIESKRKAESK